MQWSNVLPPFVIRFYSKTMSNPNEQTIQFPIALKPLLIDFVLNVLRDRIPSNELSTYAAEYFSERQNDRTTMTSEENLVDEKNQRRKSVWGGSPVNFHRCFSFSNKFVR